jgi:hypothetical protein
MMDLGSYLTSFALMVGGMPQEIVARGAPPGVLLNNVVFNSPCIPFRQLNSIDVWPLSPSAVALMPTLPAGR